MYRLMCRYSLCQCWCANRPQRVSGQSGFLCSHELLPHFHSPYHDCERSIKKAQVTWSKKIASACLVDERILLTHVGHNLPSNFCGHPELRCCCTCSLQARKDIWTAYPFNRRECPVSRLTKCQSRLLLSFFNIGSCKNDANVFLNNNWKKSVKMYLLVRCSFPPTQMNVLYLMRKLELRCFGKWQLKEERSPNGSAESYNSFWQALLWGGALLHPAMLTYSNSYSVTNQCVFCSVFFHWQCPLCPNLGYSLCPPR